MNPAAIGAALAALALLSSIVVRLMVRRGVLDIPGARSSHDRPTPKGGGLGIAAAFLVGSTAAWLAGLVPRQGWQLAALLVASILIVVVAWADDIGQFGYRAKLAAQFAAATLVATGGFAIGWIGPLGLGPIAIPLTILWLLFAMNATNFIDGLNGLASGATLVASLVVALVALPDDPLPAAALLPLSAGIAGFLPFNFPRARIFMGDAGSQLCGLVLPAMAGPASRLAHHPWGALLVPMTMAPILVDVAFTLIRRLRAGERLTEAHRGHLYQLAHRGGSSASQVTLAFWMLTLTCSVLAIYASRGPLVVTIMALVAAAIPIATAMILVLRSARQAPLGRW